MRFKAIITSTILALSPGALVAQELMDIAVPNGFFMAFEDVTADFAIREFLPEGHTLERWSLMLTTTWAPKGGFNLPSDYATGMATAFQQGCPGGTAESLGLSNENGYDAFAISITCPRSPLGETIPENAMIKVTATDDAMLTAQIAWRGTTNDDAVMRARARWLQAQRLPERAQEK